jgi:hypothetical protein
MAQADLFFIKTGFQKLFEPYSLCSEDNLGYPILFGRKSFKNILRSKTKTRPLQWYHSHADLIWPDGPFRSFCTIIIQMWLQFYNHSSSVRYALYRRIVYFALQHTVLWISTNNLSFIRWTKIFILLLSLIFIRIHIHMSFVHIHTIPN